MLTKLVSAITAAVAVLLLTSTASSAQLITEPTHIPLTLQPGECELTIANGKSVHPNTTVIVQNVDTWENIAELYDVEAEAFSTIVDTIMVPETGHVTIQVIPNPGGISSLDPQDITCTPTIAEPAPIFIEPIVETMMEPPSVPEPVDGPCEGVNADDTCGRTETPAPVEPPEPVIETPATVPAAPSEPAAAAPAPVAEPTEPETVVAEPQPETFERQTEPASIETTAPTQPMTELPETGTNTWIITATGLILLVSGTATKMFSRKLTTS